MHYIQNVKSTLALLTICWVVAAGATEVTIKHNGITLNGSLLIAEDQTPTNRTILITHGTLAHNRMEIIEALQELLSEQGHNSLAINLSLGIDNRHGSYDCALPHTYRHTDAVGEIAAWVAWLKQEGVENITVMGHSRGGNQTALYSVQYNDSAVKQVVLIAPATWSEKGAIKNYKKRYGSDLNKELKRAEAMVASGKGGELMQGVGFIYCANSQVTAAAFVSNYRPDFRRNTPDLITQIDEPLRVIVGSEDKVVKGLMEQLRKRLGDDDERVVIVDGADHFFRDLYAEELVEHIMDFIADH